MVCVAGVALVGACDRASAAHAPPPTRPSVRAPLVAGDSATWIEMRNVHLRLGDRGAIRIRRLRGEMIRAVPSVPAALDDERSFSIRITDGSVSLTGEDLAALLNGYVFAYRGAPLKKLAVRFEGDRIIQSGVMHKGVDLPFEITASLALTAEGLVRLHPERVRLLGVDGAALLGALRLRLDDLLDLSGARGASVKGNDIYLDPAKSIPPPAIVGRLASVRIEGEELVQQFVRLADDSVFGGYVRPDTSVTSFIYFRGGQMRFGKLTMWDTDLQIDDADQSDPFDLYLAKYNEQLVAGFSRNHSDLGLDVQMPDYSDIRRPPVPPVVSGARPPRR